MADSQPSKRVRNAKKQKVSTAKWTIEEKQKFVTGLSRGPPFRKENGNIDWRVLQRFIRTRTLRQVKEFAREFNALENGQVYPEFSQRAAVDVWKELAQKSIVPGDNIANVCVPQVLTVAALEPTITVPSDDQPDHNNIYSYLSAVTRGTDVPDLPANDAAVILDLLQDLIKTLSKSETLIQREHMHNRYAEMRYLMEPNCDEISTSNRNQPCGSSTNPFAIPFGVLEFKSETYKNETQ